MADEPQRLAKVVAALVPCSRREAEQYIDEGWVRVDGQRVDKPETRVGATQRVEIDAQARLQPVVPATFLVHKPAGMTVDQAGALLHDAANRWSDDASGIRRSKSHGLDLVPLLVLPRPASGLAVFSQDKGVIRKLTHDARLIEQELVADVSGTIAPNGLQRLAA
ncbi:MAG: RNA-binding protein, partial [Comamonadaceae bacterium]